MVRDRVVGVSTCYGLKGSNSGEGEIFRARPDRPWANSASCTMGIGFLSRR